MAQAPIQVTSLSQTQQVPSSQSPSQLLLGTLHPLALLGELQVFYPNDLCFSHLLFNFYQQK
jgi:hypothetical protein